MPAVDQCEPAVIRAFEKAGWVVTARPYPLKFGTSFRLYPDVRLDHDGSTIIITEGKYFPDNRNFLDDLYQTLGQFVLYQSAITRKQLDIDLYIAVPSSIYRTHFQLPLVQFALGQIAANLVLVDLELEEIVEWIG
jgi:hypothetical protein